MKKVTVAEEILDIGIKLGFLIEECLEVLIRLDRVGRELEEEGKVEEERK